MKQTVEIFARSIKNEWVRDAVVGISASLLLALCAPLSMNLPFTPIPVTIQVQVLFFLSAFLGPRKAVFMVLSFLAQGLSGLPVFAGGASTIATLLGPRGGYLVGYLVAAYVVGTIYQKSKSKSALALFLSMSVGNLLVYSCGFSWLAQFVGLKKAFFLGIAPFALADLAKLTMITILKNPVAKLLQRVCRGM